MYIMHIQEWFSRNESVQCVRVWMVIEYDRYTPTEVAECSYCGGWAKSKSAYTKTDSADLRGQAWEIHMCTRAEIYAGDVGGSYVLENARAHVLRASLCIRIYTYMCA